MRVALKRQRQELYQSLLRLIASPRAGDGAALLLQLARYQVLTLSLEKGGLYSLDPFPAKALLIELCEQIRHSDALQNLYRAQLLDLRNLLEQMKTTGHPELVMNRIEEVRGRMLELEKVLRGAKQIRYDRGKMVPEAAGMVEYAPEISPDGLRQAAGSIALELEQANRQILADYSYNLFSRNCVTEMNRRVDSSFSSRRECELGGWILPGEQFSFSPFMFHSLIRQNYDLAAEKQIRSRRLRQIEQQPPESLVALAAEDQCPYQYALHQAGAGYPVFAAHRQQLGAATGIRLA